MERPKGININIFLPEGEPEGLRIVERVGWTGVAVAANRTQLKEVLERPEMQRTGVYVLLDPGQDPDFPTIYVGEADVLGRRLREHARGEDPWTHVVAFTSKDGHLNKAHAKNIESFLVERARQARRARIRNGNLPPAPQMSEPERENVKAFLYEMLVIYPLLGVRAFEIPAVTTTSARAEPELFLVEVGVRARGRETPGGFVVLAGSQSRGSDERVQTESSRRKWEELVREGVIVPDGGLHRFAQDYLFNSPSQAAEVVVGRARNGRLAWKDAQGVSLKVLQDRELEE